MNQHLSYFTLRGVRKFDYPPSFTYHEPWWDNYRLLGDYTGRMSLVGSSGEQLNDILVLQPNTTAWMYFSRKVKNPQIDIIQRRFKSFVWQLERAHVEYDLGSEHVLKNFGSVHGDKLRARNRAYGVVVIPASMENLDQSTYELLEEFLAGGGEVLSFNTEISYLDGEPSGAINELLKSYPDQCSFAREISDPDFQRLAAREEFRINESSPVQGELYHQRRILEDGQLLMLVNSSADQAASATIEARGKSVIQLDPVSGEIMQIKSKSQGKSVSFKADLLPLGSSVYFISGRSSSLPYANPTLGEGKPVVAEYEVEVTADQANVLVLNYLDLKAGKLQLKDSYFMDALLALFDSHGLEMGNPCHTRYSTVRNT